MTLSFLRETEPTKALELLNKEEMTYKKKVKDFLQNKYHRDVESVISGTEAVSLHIKPNRSAESRGKICRILN